VIVRAGTYNASTGSSDDSVPIYNPVNSGTSGSPIVFRAEGDVILTSNTNTEGEGLIGAHDKEFYRMGWLYSR
jgi:hypothetical protein